MISTIYIEDGAKDYPLTRKVLSRYPRARIIECRHYAEVFNPRAQNFRLQKRNPALILARKTGNRILPAPAGYGIGSSRNYYFSHLLNCLYDCRYCFLQGMYRSANYLLFVNYEDFLADIARIGDQFPQQSIHFFSGYDCDSLALEPVTGFAEAFLPFFRNNPHLLLELRTKSTQTAVLRHSEASSNIVTAFSFTPEAIAKATEKGTPPVHKRIAAMRRLAEQGWPIGLRFDPVIYTEAYQGHYQRLFADIFSALPRDSLHSVSLGSFRMPNSYFQTIRRLYPEAPLLAGPREKRNNMTAYPAPLEQEMLGFCRDQILRYIPDEKFFPCPT